jgi:hypothetical protein
MYFGEIMNKQEKTFTILDCPITLTQEDCKDYESFYTNLHDKAPAELKQKLATLSKDEFVDTMSTLITEISATLDVPALIPSIKTPTPPTPLKATFTILGCSVELSEDECRSYNDVCNNLFAKLPELPQKISAISDAELVDAMANLLLEIEAKLDSPLDLENLKI